MTLTDAGEKAQVVFVGKLPGQTKATVPLKTVSGTTWRLKVAAAPACTEMELSWPLASCNS